MLDRFLNLVQRDPHAAAVIEQGRVVTRGALWARANEIAATLPRAPLALQMPNSAEFVATVLAALKLDLVVIPIDRDAHTAEVFAMREHFKPPFPNGTRVIKVTSGSTGKPKGVFTTEANLIADCTNICTTMQIAPDDINLGAIPFSHSYGFSNLVMPLILQGTAVVATNAYLPQSLVDLANEHRCTVAPLIPMVFDHLATSAHGKFESVRTFISAGAPLPVHTSRRFRERFGIPIHSFYGCSETGGITYDRQGGAAERGTVGSAMSGVDLAIENSRLTVRSEAVAVGDAFVTDDLVMLRDDGELVLTGRVSDLINTAGKKVNPREVEAVILQIEGVREAKVYGEAAGARGEVVAAAIVATAEVTREQVREFCRARLSLHKVPRIVKLLDEMPVDERGKIKRAALATL
jgi:acyl-CoA synthetase (AMP-forming)/AMP-acid ligase II